MPKLASSPPANDSTSEAINCLDLGLRPGCVALALLGVSTLLL